MRRQRGKIWWVALLTLVLAMGCSDDDTSPTAGSNDPPVFDGSSNNVTVPEGMAQSQDPMAQSAMGYVSIANTISAYGGLFAPPAGATRADGPPWTYTWTIEDPPMDITYTLTIDETVELYTWDVWIDGTPDGELVFDNWHFYHAEQNKTTGCGLLTFYGYETLGTMTWTWCTDAQGVFTLTMEYLEDGVDQIRIVLVVNPDGSGSLEVSEYIGADQWCDIFVVEWDVLGNGEWWTYENCEQVATGSWTVPVN